VKQVEQVETITTSKTKQNKQNIYHQNKRTSLQTEQLPWGWSQAGCRQVKTTIIGGHWQKINKHPNRYNNTPVQHWQKKMTANLRDMGAKASKQTESNKNKNKSGNNPVHLYSILARASQQQTKKNKK